MSRIGKLPINIPAGVEISIDGNKVTVKGKEGVLTQEVNPSIKINYDKDKAEITFDIDPFRFTKGSGYWVDYYSGAPWDYVANHISWRVDNGNIYIHFREDDTSVVIADYHLTDSRFSGYIADGDNDVYFNLFHTSSPNWDNYNNWGYDAWCDDYYYSRETRGEGADSTAATPAKPIRQFGKKAE